MITPDQIRAARALKNWNQAELAERAGIATPSIANIELGKQKPSAQTLEKIHEAFLLGGIEFTKTGVAKKSTDERITVVTSEDLPGNNVYLSLLEDVYLTLKDAPADEKDVFFVGLVDQISPPPVNEMMRKLRKTGIRFKNFICETDDYIMGKLEEYRLIPKAEFVNTVRIIYGPKYAVAIDSSLEKPEPGAIVIFNDRNVADAHRGVMEILWRILPQPDQTSAQEHY